MSDMELRDEIMTLMVRISARPKASGPLPPFPASLTRSIVYAVPRWQGRRPRRSSSVGPVPSWPGTPRFRCAALRFDAGIAKPVTSPSPRPSRKPLPRSSRSGSEATG